MWYDKEFAKICTWLKSQNLTMHVKLDGEVFFCKKEDKGAKDGSAALQRDKEEAVRLLG